MLLIHFLPFFLSFSYEQVLHFSPLVLHSSFLQIRWVCKRQEITARIPTSKTTTKSQSIETKVHLRVLPRQAAAAETQPLLLSENRGLLMQPRAAFLRKKLGVLYIKHSIILLTKINIFSLSFLTNHYPEIKSWQDFVACSSTVIPAGKWWERDRDTHTHTLTFTHRNKLQTADKSLKPSQRVICCSSQAGQPNVNCSLSAASLPCELVCRMHQGIPEEEAVRRVIKDRVTSS